MMPPMLHTAYKLNTTRNEYGDFVISSQTALSCHFRVITEIQFNGNADAVQSDAMAWFESDSGIQRGDVIKFEGTHYQVERLTEARRLRDPKVLFIKCDLLKYGPIS